MDFLCELKTENLSKNIMRKEFILDILAEKDKTLNNQKIQMEELEKENVRLKVLLAEKN